MQFENLLLLLDSVLVAGLAAWMIVAVRDNWMHPKMNLEAVAMVVRFDAMAEEFPEDYAEVAHRRIDDPARVKLIFHLIRWAETAAAVMLSLSALLLFIAAFGSAGVVFATGMALVSTAFFASIWAGFIIGGNYFAYWYSHQWAQMNHFSLLFWSLLVFIALLN
ncbi:MAG: DUF2165 family protein [Pseudomonadota bacterium]